MASMLRRATRRAGVRRGHPTPPRGREARRRLRARLPLCPVSVRPAAHVTRSALPRPDLWSVIQAWEVNSNLTWSRRWRPRDATSPRRRRRGRQRVYASRERAVPRLRPFHADAGVTVGLGPGRAGEQFGGSREGREEARSRARASSRRSDGVREAAAEASTEGLRKLRPRGGS